MKAIILRTRDAAFKAMHDQLIGDSRELFQQLEIKVLVEDVTLSLPQVQWNQLIRSRKALSLSCLISNF
jgi:hypothetical protein